MLTDILKFGDKDEELTVIPTYGYLDSTPAGDFWNVRMRVWVHEERFKRLGRFKNFLDDLTDPLILRLTDDLSEIRGEERRLLRKRLTDFIADSESGKEVAFKFVGDPDNTVHRFTRPTDLNGLVEQDFMIRDETVRHLLARADGAPGWLTVTAMCEGHEKSGRIRMLEPEGLSVVSDIDDTIKITEIPAGHTIILRNTFLRKYEAVPGMVDRYRAFGPGTAFHYVSAGPWQLFNLLHAFLVTETGFPEGTFHMRNLRSNLLTDDSRQDIIEFLFGGKDATERHKKTQITRLMKNTPGRKFILIGDSGEQDPKIFSELRDEFGTQVQQIIIRDVVDERNKPGSRLKGMTVLEAPTILPGISQLTG